MTMRPSKWRHLFIKYVTATIVWIVSLVATVLASPFTTTVPSTSIIIPSTYPQAGGIVIVLEGANGNIYYQFANPYTMFKGYQNAGTPAAFNGNPFQIAPAAALNCGISSCSSYLGGGITRVSIRFTAYDGDSQTGMFDFNDLTLRLNGIDVGNWSPVATQNTNLAGTTVISSNTGFGNNTFDTGWFQSTNPTLLSNILTTGSLKSTVYDADPNDNFWDFTQGSDANTSTVPLTVAPGFSIDKTASSTAYAAVGDIITYNYLVTNIGSVYINNLTVSDDKIGAVACSPTVIYPVAGPTGVSNCSKAYTVTQANIDAGSITNSATALGTPQAGSLGAVSDSLTIIGPASAPSMVLTKTAAPTPFGAVGTSLVYTFTMQNTGNVTLTNSAVTDPSLPTLSCMSGPIAPGLTGILTCTGNSHLVTQADIDRGFIINSANGSAKAPSGATITSKASINTAGPVQVRSITIAKSSSAPTYSLAGNTITYGYLITNTGNVTLTNAINVSDDKIASVYCPPLPISGIAPNATLTCTGTYTITQADLNAGSVTNTASAISGTTATTANAVKTITAIQNRALTIDKRSSTLSFSAVGDVISYSFLVINSGNVTLSSPVTVSDNNIAPIPGVICPALPDAGATMNPGSSIICTAIYIVTQTDLDAGSVTNMATATSGSTTSASDTYTVPAIQTRSTSLVKTATSVAFAVPGDQVTYDYLITNNGNVTLTGPFTVADNRIAPANIVCPAGNVAPLGQIACTGTYSVLLDDLTLGSVTNVASASNGTTTSPQASVTVPTGANPALTIKKTTIPAVSGFNAVGDLISYSFIVINSGNASFTRPVDVVDDKIGTIACFTPTIGHLVFIAGETITCTASYSVTQADLDAGFVTNQAFGQTTFGGVGPVGNIPVASPPDAVTVNAGQAPHMTVTKTAAILPVTNVGQALTYTISVKNDGNVTLSYINISDPLIPGLSCAITILAVAASNQSCTATYYVKQSDFNAGVINNTASALGLTPQGATVTASGSVFTPIAQTSGVIIDKALAGNADEDASGTVSLNDTLSYVVSVTNTGNISQTNVIVNDPQIAPSTTTCATLAPAAICTLSGTHIVTLTEADAGFIYNTGAATSSLITSPVIKTLSTTVPQNASLSIAKALTSSGVATLNSVLTYDVTATNDGNITQNNVLVTDSKITPSTMMCATLAPAGTCVLSGTHTVTQSELDAGQVNNTGTVTSTLLPIAESVTISTPVVQISSLAIEKVIAANNDTDGSGSITLGDTLTYAVTATNDGSVTQSNITVSDSKLNTSTVTCASLAPAGTCVLSGTYVVTQSDVDAGTIGNTGSVTSTLLPVPLIVTIATPVTQTSSLSIAKVQTATGPFLLGSILTYDVAVTNDGTISQGNVVVSDANISPNTVTCASLLPSATCVLSGTHTVTQREVDAGKVDNNADVTSTSLPTPQTAFVTTPVAQVNSLGIVKAQTSNDDADGSGTISLNDTLTFMVKVTNDGTVTQDDIIVSDSKITPNNVTCASLAPLETCILIGTYLVKQSDVDAGSISNTGSVTSTLLPTPETMTIATPIAQNSSLNIAKLLTSTGSVELGTVLTYDVTVTNNGNVSQSGVLVSDSKITPNSLTCANLLPAATCVLSGSYTVTQSDMDAGTIGNTGSVTSTLLPTPQTVTIATQIMQVASLETTKIITGSGSVAGEIVTYKITVHNTGNITLNDLNLTDNLTRAGGTSLSLTTGPSYVASDLGSPAGMLLPSETATYQATYRLVSADISAGGILNSATAIGTASPTVSNPIPSPVSDVSDNGIDTDGNTVNDPTRLLLDPSGVIYSSATGLPISGVTVFLTSASGSPLPSACLLPSQQGQLTGATGEYRFDIITGGAPACPVGETEYWLSVTVPSGYLSAISTVYPPQSGSVDATTCPLDAVPGGLCQISASVTAPPAGTTYPYYLSFLFAAGDRDVVNNHIPIDAAPVLTAGNLTVEKTASVRVAHRGDVVIYTIVVRNGTLTAVGPIDVVDTLPSTFTYQPNSATLQGVATVPNASGRTLTFAGITVPPRSQKTIQLAVRIGVNVTPGDYVNEAVAKNPATGAILSNTAKALVRIEFEHVFDCGDVIGKVFDDKNSSGYQDKGETGLPGVRLATVKGMLITTDKNGQFHVPCPELPDAKIGSNFLLKLDIRTLPSGYSVTTENPRLVRLTPGKVTKLNFGAAPPKTIRIEIDATVFDGDGALSGDLSRDLEPILERFSSQPVTLHLTYRQAKSEGANATKHVAKIEALVRRKWGALSNQTLTLETRLVVPK